MVEKEKLLKFLREKFEDWDYAFMPLEELEIKLEEK